MFFHLNYIVSLFNGNAMSHSLHLATKTGARPRAQYLICFLTKSCDISQFLRNILSWSLVLGFFGAVIQWMFLWVDFVMQKNRKIWSLANWKPRLMCSLLLKGKNWIGFLVKSTKQINDKLNLWNVRVFFCCWNFSWSHFTNGRTSILDFVVNAFKCGARERERARARRYGHIKLPMHLDVNPSILY